MTAMDLIMPWDWSFTAWCWAGPWIFVAVMWIAIPWLDVLVDLLAQEDSHG